jgi:WD40 repeat protein
MCVAFAGDDNLLATGGIDGAVRLWDHKTGVIRPTLSGHKSWVNSLAFHPGGKLLASGSSDGTIQLWAVAELTTKTPPPKNDPPRAAKIIRATTAEVRSIAFSPDGRLLAAGLRYGLIKIWETDRWSQRLEWKGHEEDAWTVAFTPDGKALASGNGGWDRPGHVKLWDVSSGKLLRSIAHTGEVLTLAISADGRNVAAGGGDKRLHLAPLAD